MKNLNFDREKAQKHNTMLKSTLIEIVKICSS